MDVIHSQDSQTDSDGREVITPPVAEPVLGLTPPGWRYAPDAWRIAHRVDIRYVDALFRLRSAAILPGGQRGRFIELGIPPDVVNETLRSIRRTREWSVRWIETAQRFLGEFRRQVSGSNPRDAEKARHLAALCYHAAQIFELEDDRVVRQCRAAAASLFTQALPVIYPNARHITVPWRTASLPAYFLAPDRVTDPVGLVVFLNGVSMSKEETISWSPRFLERGYAILALDSPGTGEASGAGDAEGDQDDILDGVFEIFRDEPMIDLQRVVVAGASLGGNQAVRAAAHDRRIMATVAVTPPYEPQRWIRKASPLLLQEMGLLKQGTVVPELWDRVEHFSLADAAKDARQPLLVFGAGRDLLVPPTDSQHLAREEGVRATLVWYPRGGHCLYEAVDQWTFEAATWIEAVADALRDPQLRGDAAATSAHARTVLEAADYVPRPRTVVVEPEEEFDEYARLLGDPE
jgi:pimeloyl-ACP methyl ester carboxylesterase